jgi:hypothetical protein
VFAQNLFGVALVVPRYLQDLNTKLAPICEWIVWYSGVPVTLGVGLASGVALAQASW